MSSPVLYDLFEGKRADPKYLGYTSSLKEALKGSVDCFFEDSKKDNPGNLHPFDPQSGAPKDLTNIRILITV